MAVLYAHDHRVHTVNGEHFSTGSIGDLRQYSSVFGTVLAVTRLRVSEPKDVQGMQRLKNHDVTYVGVPDLSSLFRVRNLSSMWASVRSSGAVVARLPSVLGAVAAAMAWSLRKPYLVELVGCPWDAYRLRSSGGRVVAPFMWAVTRLLVQKATRVIYVTETFLQTRYPTGAKTAAISNVVLRDGLDELRRYRVNLVGRRRGEDSTFVIGTSADVGLGYKGQKHVIRAIGLLRAHGVEVRYRLAGGGDQSHLRSVARQCCVSDRVEFYGHLSKDELWRWYAGLDLYIHPSETEGLPRSLIEAMSLGVPSAGSQIGGIPELLPEGYMFDAGDHRSIAATLMDLLAPSLAVISSEGIDTASSYRYPILKSRRQKFIQEFYDEVS